MNDALRYEYFCLHAFSLRLKQTQGIEYLENLISAKDPASLAKSDTYHIDYLNDVKACTAYAIGIYRNILGNYIIPHINEKVICERYYQVFNNAIECVIISDNLDSIMDVIKDVNSVKEHFFNNAKFKPEYEELL